MRAYWKICLLFLFSSHFGFARNDDTLRLKKTIPSTTYYNLNQFENASDVNYINNSLDNLQNTMPRNNLGNSGLAFNDFFYQPFINDLGFRYYKNNFLNYCYTKDNLLFFDTRKPYTDLYYQLGSKKEQDFKMTFSYNVKKNWNITANFFRIRSDGFYERQNTNDNFVSLSSNFKSKNNRYNLLFGFIYNNVKNAENGGVADDSLFESNPCVNKSLVAVNLYEASITSQNTTIFLNQYFNLGKKDQDTLSEAIFYPSSRVLLATSFDGNTLKYDDGNPLSGFYSNVYFDSVTTNDRTSNINFENELSWKRLDNKKHRGFLDYAGFGVNFKDQYIQLKQKDLDTTFNNIILGAQVYNTYSHNNLWFKLAGHYDITGYNKNDYLIDGIIKKGVFDSLTFLNFGFSTRLQTPDFIYQKYTSNNFIWNNNFNQIKENIFSLGFEIKKYKLAVTAGYKTYTNPVYFNSEALASQYNGKVSVAYVSLKKDIKFHNWNFNNSFQYQYVPDSSVIRLPEFAIESSLFYENDFFNNALKAQFGLFLHYNTAFYSNRYMPATTQFYWQGSNTFGNYPFLDFFINFKIKEVRIFFKIDHLNYCWSDKNFMLTPSYPMNDIAYKLGISWRFYD